MRDPTLLPLLARDGARMPAFAARVRLAPLTVALLLAVAACAKGDRAADDTAAAGSEAAASGAASSASGSSEGALDEWMSDRDLRALAGTRLSDDKLDKLERGIQSLTELNRSDPAVLDRVELESDSANARFSIDEFVSRVEAEPKLRRAVESSGLSVRDFLLTYFALSFAQNQAQAQGQQTLPDTTNMPADARATMRELYRMADRMRRAVPEENVAYVRRNEARVRRVIEAMEAIDPDDDPAAVDTAGR
jgi:hypothetical protein